MSPAASIQGHVEHVMKVTSDEHILSQPPIRAGNELRDGNHALNILRRSYRREARTVVAGGPRRLLLTTKGRQSDDGSNHEGEMLGVHGASKDDGGTARRRCHHFTTTIPVASGLYGSA